MTTWMPHEEWPIEVSRCGKVRSLSRITSQNILIVGKLITPSIDRDGYHIVPLRLDGKRKHGKVHRLVLEVHDRYSAPGEQCDHIDGDRTNNDFSNLEWVSCRENNKRRDARRKSEGRPPMAAKSFSFIKDGIIETGNNMADFCRKHNLASSGMSRVRSGKLNHYRQWRLFDEYGDK